MEIISIEVDSDVAKAFREADSAERQRIQGLVNTWLKQTIRGRSLDEIIDDLQTQASARGLTSDILEHLLQDE
ncbi:MAG: hypothetical protein WBA57_06010 [Elainellaceae cyanobacterium]